jgi:hypothetical protein
MARYCSTPLVLTLSSGTTTLDLMDDASGLRVAEVTVAFPDVRDDVNLRPDAHGTLDYTHLFGARAVSISGFAVPAAGKSRQAALRSLAPFLDPTARPTLTYQLDADVPARTMTLRGAQFDAPANNPTVSHWAAGWKAADPMLYDAAVQLVIVRTGTQAGGRTYNLTFPRLYPAGGGAYGQVANQGTQTAYPHLRIFGPASNVSVSELVGTVTYIVAFKSTMVMVAGDVLDVDTRTHTVLLNGTNALPLVAWNPNTANPQWPVLPAGQLTVWQFSASNTGPATQLQITWQDTYLL